MSVSALESNAVATTTESVVEIGVGKLRGAYANGVHSFKGVPYGETTAGVNRFAAPQPKAAWAGIRDAVDFGLRAPQPSTPRPDWQQWITDQRPSGEDCLVLNVYTPSIGAGAARPVMVWLHGGAFVTGSGSSPGLDGTNLARGGDVVVVTINHRLNAFGFCHLAEFDRARYADAGNAGMLDIVTALAWVRDHIAAFGGDPRNVTIFGQSGGGSKVAVVMAMPAARGLFHRAVIQSASSLIRMASIEDASRAAHALLAELQIDRHNLDTLASVPTNKVLAARGAVLASGIPDNFRPVVDGRALLVNPFDPTAPELSADIPLLIGSSETETTFFLGPDPSNFTLTADKVRGRIRDFMKLDDAGADRLIGAYRRHHPEASPSELWFLITSDQQYRRNNILAAERKALQSKAPAYMYLFTWKSPVLGGALEAPHTLCIPFVFGTYDIAAKMLGTGPERRVLSERVMAAWVAFARTGDPNHGGLPPWPRYSADARPTMIFDNACEIRNDPRRDDRVTLEDYPLYTPDQSVAPTR